MGCVHSWQKFLIRFNVGTGGKGESDNKKTIRKSDLYTFYKIKWSLPLYVNLFFPAFPQLKQSGERVIDVLVSPDGHEADWDSFSILVRKTDLP